MADKQMIRRKYLSDKIRKLVTLRTKATTEIKPQLILGCK